MADDMEYALSCSICMELYNEPVLLPCAHSLCRACLEKLRRPSGKAVSKTIDCPQCRRKLDLGENCENVKKNFQLASIIDIYRQESSRRQQLDAERPPQSQPQPQLQQQQLQNQLLQLQQAQRIHELQRPQPAARPKRGFLAQFRQKQNKKKESPSNQQERSPSTATTENGNAGAQAYLLNALSALRKTSADHSQETKPTPRRSAPPPPLPKPRGSATLSPEHLDSSRLAPGRRSLHSLLDREPPPIPSRSYTLKDLHTRLTSGNVNPSASQPSVSSTASSQVSGASSENQDLQGTQESEESATEDQPPSSPALEVSDSTSPDTPPALTTEQPTNIAASPPEQPTGIAASSPEQPNQDAEPTSTILPATQEPDILLNIPEVTFPEVPERTQPEQCSSVNDATPDCCTCERVPAFPATVQCHTCAMPFCSSCLGTFHPEPDDSQHDVRPIKELKVEEKCVLCEKERWSIFCMQCNMLFCSGCMLGHHPVGLKHWTHAAPAQRSMSITAIPVPSTQPTLQRRTASVPSGMATQGLEEATGGPRDETQCSSCTKAAFARCLDCGENLCELCARVKHQSADLENHTVVKLSESKLNMEDVEKMVQHGLLELMLLKQALMEELSSKVKND